MNMVTAQPDKIRDTKEIIIIIIIIIITIIIIIILQLTTLNLSPT